MLDAQFPGQWKETVTNFTVGNTTVAKILADVTPAQVLAAVSGETALPGESAVRQQVLRGGQRIIDGSIASTDGTARSMLFYIGSQTSLYANMGAVTTTTSTIVRTVGSFITDGYQVGDMVMMFGAANAANNGIVAIVTTVAALTLTVNGTPLTADTMGSGFRIFRLALLTRRGIPLSSGNTDSAPPVALLGGTQDPARAALPDSGLSLGANGALIGAMVANISALPAVVSVSLTSALY